MVRRELWAIKVGLLEQAIAQKGLEIHLESLKDADIFRSLMNNFRATVNKHPAKYPLEVALWKQLAVIRGSVNATSVIITPKTGKNRGESLLLAVASALNG